MDLVELGAVLGDFFEAGDGPSHDQLDQAIARTGLTGGDPAEAGRTRHGTPLGKTKRIRQVLVHATDHDPAAGLKLAQQVVALLRADGAFSPALESYAGQQKIGRLADAFARIGFTLDPNGALRPTVIDNLAGTQLTEALQTYVNRINLNPDDAPLQIGSGRELDEAAARHVLQERTGSYPIGGHAGSFPVTLAGAFTAIGFAVPPQPQLDSDPHRQVQQCLFLLGVAVNRLRNQAGSGHGRPGQPDRVLQPSEARLVARATALIAGALLDEL
jgi:hypothetical protein